MQQQQYLLHMNMMEPSACYFNNNVTTDHIQQYLDENKFLILKIVESQNSGKLSECAEDQARLRRNLMYLAAIADSQPQQSMHSQYAGSGNSHPGTNYLQHQQSQHQMMTQSLMAARSLYAHQAYPSLQQQTLHGQLGMSSGGRSSGLMLQRTSSSLRFPDYNRNSGDARMMQASGSKQGIGSVSGEGRGCS